MRVPLTARTLPDLSDGYAEKTIDEAMASVWRDVQERGHDGNRRKLVITLTYTPDDKGIVDIDLQVKTTVPAYRPPATKAKLNTRAGGLMFNTESADNPDQQTFSDIDNRAE
jgi:hypothetical protein